MGFEEQLKNIVAFVPDTTPLNVGEAGTGSSAEAVPVDHQRYVYFAKFWTVGPATIVSVFEDLGGVLTLKEQQLVTANQTVQIPAAGPSRVPVYRFRGTSFIQIQLSVPTGPPTNGVGVSMEFLDKPGGN